MAGKEKFKVEEVVKAIKETTGLLALTAQKLGCDYSTIYNYSQRHPQVKAAIVEAKERNLDFAEGKLYELIRKGEPAAIFFYLKTQGKSRGYIERSEQTVDVTTKGEAVKPYVINIGQDKLQPALAILGDAGAIRLGVPNNTQN
ncbi:MAG: hypothetical protein A9183_03015 [Dehalococcoides mccartyi]|uniref:hypothetical protein n=1 Tax=Dehalococcoides mccartyi TaxID=61435 RepID=UPI00080603F3|nr:hypothetical protein [Dehalococcoides mccartyi]OBW61089.1 MAG: hypothetical protein A9183_03015 [Dehalococcoides mccartyi]